MPKMVTTGLSTMVRDGEIYDHDPATVGHEQRGERHTAACWTLRTGDEAPGGYGPHAIVRARR